MPDHMGPIEHAQTGQRMNEYLRTLHDFYTIEVVDDVGRVVAHAAGKTIQEMRGYNYRDGSWVLVQLHTDGTGVLMEFREAESNWGGDTPVDGARIEVSLLTVKSYAHA